MPGLDFLNSPSGGEQPVAPDPQIEPAAEPAPQVEALEPVDGQPRGPDGRFAPRDPALEPALAAELPPEPQPQPEPQIPPGFVPIAALQEERDRRQAAEARLATPQPQPQPSAQPRHEAPQRPDPFEDPAGYAEWQEAVFENRLFNQSLNFSETFARQKHGDATVNEVQQWAKPRLEADPIFAAQFRQQSDPYGFIVAEYRKDKLFSGLSDNDYAAFEAWRAAQAAPNPNPNPAPAPAQQVLAPPITPAPPPPRSIASAPSAGGPAAVPVGPGQAYDRAFRRG